MAGQSPLQTLANELILSIVEMLDFASLVHLNAANRRLHNLTHKHLYSSFHGHDYGKFLRTLASSTNDVSISNYVKSATCLIRQSKHIFQGITETDRHRIQDKFTNLPLPDAASQSDLLSNYAIYGDSIQHHWFMDFFLLFLPKLETLVIHDAWQWNDHQYWFTHTAANATYLSNLHTITIHGPLRTKNVLPLFTLPSLREITLIEVVETRQAAGATWEWDTPSSLGTPIETTLRKHGSNVHTLCLKNSYIKSHDLSLILSSIKSLKSYSYTHTPNPLAVPTPIDPDFANLAILLSKHASTLERLTVLHTEPSYTNGTFPLISPDCWADVYDPTFPYLRTLSLSLVFPAGDFTSEGDFFTDEGKADMRESVERFFRQIPKTLEELEIRIRFMWTYTGGGMGNWWVRCFAECGGWEGRVVRRVRVWCDMEDGMGIREDGGGVEVDNGVLGDEQVARGIFGDAGVEFVWERGQWDVAS